LDTLHFTSWQKIPQKNLPHHLLHRITKRIHHPSKILRQHHSKPEDYTEHLHGADLLLPCGTTPLLQPDLSHRLCLLHSTHIILSTCIALIYCCLAVPTHCYSLIFRTTCTGTKTLYYHLRFRIGLIRRRRQGDSYYLGIIPACSFVKTASTHKLGRCEPWYHSYLRRQTQFAHIFLARQ
jgi:hypothetical protein